MIELTFLGKSFPHVASHRGLVDRLEGDRDPLAACPVELGLGLLTRAAF